MRLLILLCLDVGGGDAADAAEGGEGGFGGGSFGGGGLVAADDEVADDGAEGAVLLAGDGFGDVPGLVGDINSRSHKRIIAQSHKRTNLWKKPRFC
jgi:hypothetical protein